MKVWYLAAGWANAVYPVAPNTDPGWLAEKFPDTIYFYSEVEI